MIYLSGICYESFADAFGVSTVLFVSGCKHYCKGCHSPETHHFQNGQPLTDDLICTINAEIDKRPFLSALVLSGGDPMYSAKSLVEVLPKLHIPHQNIWCYSGFTFEQILSDPDMTKLLSCCTVLIDGMFEEDKRDITLSFRGSTNQRVIDVQTSLRKNKAVIWQKGMNGL